MINCQKNDAFSQFNKEDMTLKSYNEEDIRRAVDEVVAAGMEKFLYQEPFSLKDSSQSSRRKS